MAGCLGVSVGLLFECSATRSQKCNNVTWNPFDQILLHA